MLLRREGVLPLNERQRDVVSGRSLPTREWGGQEWGWARFPPEKLTVFQDEENQVLQGKQAQRHDNGW